MLDGLTDPLRRTIARSVRRTFGAPPDELNYPPGDPGWFGPGSATWRVHEDLITMMIGGVSSLFLQSLHPGAMAGVADHSDYKRDPLGRLRRTARFISGTTFGSSAMVERLVARVRARHDTVHGLRPDGIPYSAHDPDLLRWVHVAEVSQFLAAYQRYGARPLSAAGRDRYFGEVARVAEALGATLVPRTEAEVAAYFRAVRPALQGGSRPAEVAGFLMRPPAGEPIERAGYHVICRASVDLLPEWAQEMLELTHSAAIELRLVRPAARALAATFRWATGGPEAARLARRRVAALPGGDIPGSVDTLSSCMYRPGTP